jgi:hypothetical protein
MKTNILFNYDELYNNNENINNLKLYNKQEYDINIDNCININKKNNNEVNNNEIINNKVNNNEVNNNYMSIKIDENNIFIWQKIVYYLMKYCNLNSGNYHLHGILNVLGKKTFFIIPHYPFEFSYNNQIITGKYIKEQESKPNQGVLSRMEYFIFYGNKKTIMNWLEFCRKMDFEKTLNKIKYVWKDNYWRYSNTFKKRKLDTVYLPKKQKNEIINEIKIFLDTVNNTNQDNSDINQDNSNINLDNSDINQDNSNINLDNNDINQDNNLSIYEKLDIPERKVFLFYGRPGTGKTTFIRALASEFNLNIAVVKNSQELSDNDVDNMISELHNNTLLLFEDIDSLFNGRNSVSFNNNLSFSGLLNLLDGCNSYNKLLIFITTNKKECLDPAFLRRIDRFIEFDFMRIDEIKLMFNKFFENKYIWEEFNNIIRNKKITPNSLEKYFTRCLLHNISPIENSKELFDYTNFTNENDDKGMYV